jgi:dolichol-phosphate mannosyltransferase
MRFAIHSVKLCLLCGANVALSLWESFHLKWDAGTGYGRRLASASFAGQWQALVLGVAGCAFVLRWLYAGAVDLMPEETYYWNYSRHLDIGYLDHPPLVAWLIRLGTTVFGDNEFGVRFGALACGVTTSVLVFRLTRNLFGEHSALIALALSVLLPFFFMTGFLMTPDAPLTAAWAAALYFLERALIGGRPRAWAWAGLAFGVGLLAKYTIALLGVATLVFMLLDPPSRRWFRRWEPYAAVLIAAVVFAPVILWNAQHDWVSFVFQTSRRLAERPRFSLHKLIGGAMVLITPTGVIAVGVAFARGLPERFAVTGEDVLRRRWLFLKVCLIVPLAVFLLFSLRHEVKLDWTGAPWVAALPLLALGISESFERGGPPGAQWLRVAWPPTLLVMLSVYAFGLYYLVLGVPGVGYSKHTELVPVAWRDFGRQIEDLADELRRETGADVLIVGMDRYAIASEAAFYASDRARAVATTSSGHLFGDVGLMYERWFPIASQAGRTLLLVAWDEQTLTDPRLARQVDRLDPVHQGMLMHNDRTVRTYYYRVAHDYRPDPPKEVGH